MLYSSISGRISVALSFNSSSIMSSGILGSPGPGLVWMSPALMSSFFRYWLSVHVFFPVSQSQPPQGPTIELRHKCVGPRHKCVGVRRPNVGVRHSTIRPRYRVLTPHYSQSHSLKRFLCRSFPGKNLLLWQSDSESERLVFSICKLSTYILWF